MRTETRGRRAGQAFVAVLAAIASWANPAWAQDERAQVDQMRMQEELVAAERQQIAQRINIQQEFVGRPHLMQFDPGSSDYPPIVRRPGATQPEIVMTVRGDRLVGRVVGLSNDGRLKLASPQYDGEVKVLANDITEVTLAMPQSGGGKDSLLMTNGDLLVGDIKGITADEIAMVTDAAGEVKVPRKMVQSLALGKSADALLDSDFANGRMDPWKKMVGTWQLRDGMLVCDSANGNNNTIAAPVDQSGPVTLEVSVEATGSRPLSVFMAMFVDNSAVNTYGNNNVYASLYYSDLNIGWYQNGGSSTVMNRNVNQIRGPATLRFGYDPESHKSRFWMNGQLVAEADVASGPARGKYVMLGTQYGCRIKSIRMISGVATPAEVAAAKSETDVVHFLNKDHLTAKSLLLANGEFSVVTPYGELKSPAAKVASITFSTREQEKPRRQRGDVLVQTSNSRLTLAPESLDDTSLVATSDYLGKVTVPRDRVKSIRFNVNQSK